MWPVGPTKDLFFLDFHVRNELIVQSLISLSILFYVCQVLTPYKKKKYVWKMLYIHMLGYDVDFGHMEAVSLISAPKYPEKQVRQ